MEARPHERPDRRPTAAGSAQPSWRGAGAPSESSASRRISSVFVRRGSYLSRSWRAGCSGASDISDEQTHGGSGGWAAGGAGLGRGRCRCGGTFAAWRSRHIPHPLVATTARHDVRPMVRAELSELMRSDRIGVQSVNDRQAVRAATDEGARHQRKRSWTGYAPRFLGHRRQNIASLGR